MSVSIRWRLSGMMVLIYAVQGSFWPLLAVHLADLGIEGRGRGWIFATFALGSLAMPLGAGSLVDRLMPTQRYLALIYAMATGILAILALGVFRQVWSLYRALPHVLAAHGPGIWPEHVAGHAPVVEAGRGVRPGPALGDDRLDDGGLARLRGHGRVGLGTFGDGHVRGVLGGGGPGDGLLGLLLDPAEHAAPGRRRAGRLGMARRIGPGSPTGGRRLPGHLVRRLADHAVCLPGRPDPPGGPGHPAGVDLHHDDALATARDRRAGLDPVGPRADRV